MNKTEHDNVNSSKAVIRSRREIEKRAFSIISQLSDAQIDEAMELLQKRLQGTKKRL